MKHKNRKITLQINQTKIKITNMHIIFKKNLGINLKMVTVNTLITQNYLKNSNFQLNYLFPPSNSLNFKVQEELGGGSSRL